MMRPTLDSNVSLSASDQLDGTLFSQPGDSSASLCSSSTQPMDRLPTHDDVGNVVKPQSLQSIHLDMNNIQKNVNLAQNMEGPRRSSTQTHDHSHQSIVMSDQSHLPLTSSTLSGNEGMDPAIPSMESPCRSSTQVEVHSRNTVKLSDLCSNSVNSSEKFCNLSNNSKEAEHSLVSLPGVLSTTNDDQSAGSVDLPVVYKSNDKSKSIDIVCPENNNWFEVHKDKSTTNQVSVYWPETLEVNTNTKKVKDSCSNYYNCEVNLLKPPKLPDYLIFDGTGDWELFHANFKLLVSGFENDFNLVSLLISCLRGQALDIARVTSVHYEKLGLPSLNYTTLCHIMAKSYYRVHDTSGKLAKFFAAKQEDGESHLLFRNRLSMLYMDAFPSAPEDLHEANVHAKFIHGINDISKSKIWAGKS